jgi:hypothetical protein
MLRNAHKWHGIKKSDYWYYVKMKQVNKCMYLMLMKIISLNQKQHIQFMHKH